MSATVTSLPARFWAKVDKTETCWLWTAGAVATGYGCFNLDGHTRSAHCFAYEDVHGPVPQGLCIDHLIEAGVCTSKLCVRPGHLEVVTLAENTRRRRAWELQQRDGLCKRGHPLPETPNKFGRRRCRTCEAWADRDRRLARGGIPRPRRRRLPDALTDAGRAEVAR